MAQTAAKRPAGQISKVFLTGAERQGAYDLLDNPQVELEQMQQAMAAACAARSRKHPFVFVPVDGSSLALTDRGKTKDFGSIGTLEAGARGLKVMSAIALDPQGVPLGLCAQRWWTRQGTQPQGPSRASRSIEEKETQHWLDVVEDTCRRFAEGAPGTRCWFQLDREGDAWPTLCKLAASGHLFTVRAAWNRRVQLPSGGKSHLRQVLQREPVLGTYDLHVPAGPGRSERTARMVVRAKTVDLDLRDKKTNRHQTLRVTAVWCRESRTTPRGAKPLDWLLLTNASVTTLEQARQVVFGYSQRWRIEEFHRTWKSGACNVEQTQLRSTSHVTKWATLLAAVALRIERLKYLARNEPNLPATVELTPLEIRALLLLKRKYKKRNEHIPDAMPTIGQATRWIAELGGYTGKSSGGPPGSITIQRGLDEIRAGALILEALDEDGKM